MESIGCELPIPLAKNELPSFTPKSTGTCVRFYPERFFQTQAVPFQEQYYHSKEVKTEHPVVHMTLQDTKLDADDPSTSKYPMTLTYLHLRKCGGTTIFRSLSDRSLVLPYHVNKYNRMMIEKLGVVRDIIDPD